MVYGTEGADVIVSKLVDHLPLYRQEQRYARQGFSIARSTLCGWLAEAADVLTPLWQSLKERVLSADIVNTDDTPVPVQDPDRDHCRTGRIWVYLSRQGTVYDATEDRSRDGPLAFLKVFRGYLQCDAYAACPRRPPINSPRSYLPHPPNNAAAATR